jgi:hypothetical protein
MSQVTGEAEQAKVRQKELVVGLRESYDALLDEQMGLLYNQFVAFIAAAELPLPEVLMVLEIISHETINQARLKYMGGIE